MSDKNIEMFIRRMSENAHLGVKFDHALRGGKNKVYHNIVSEVVALADDWIITLDSALHSVENIVRNPRKFIVDEDSVVDVERAKRTTARTVRHLASHSQNIRSITEDGEVTPKKLLTTEINEDLAIYENRFVVALIKRLVVFVEQRYQDINGRMTTYDITRVGIHSDFKYGEAALECDFSVNVKEPPHDKIQIERNRDLLDRIALLRRRLKILQSTEFVRALSSVKPVRPPIMKTNLIKMNVDYQNCYQLWLYIASYQFVGYSVTVKEKSLPVDGNYFDDLAYVAGLGVRSLFVNHALNAEEYDAIPFSQPKTRDFKIKPEYKYQPSFTSGTKSLGEDGVNEYYFNQMKTELMKATRRGNLSEERVLKLNFARFFKAIAKLNNLMYDDVIDSHKQEKSLVRLSPLKKKENALKVQQLVYRRHQQLSRLKREDLEKTLAAEARELIKLEKAKDALDLERGKIRSKKLAAAKRKERLEKIKAKKRQAEEKAKKYEATLRERDKQKLFEIEEQKRLKREAATRRRELKKLEQLKEKYEDESDT